MKKDPVPYQRIVLFDGVCNLCNSTVDFILFHDKKDSFKFASLQSEAAKQLLQMPHPPLDLLANIILFEDDKFYRKSTAALRIARYLDRPYRYAYILILIPPFIRDAVYTLIASHRYKWFGEGVTH